MAHRAQGMKALGDLDDAQHRGLVGGIDDQPAGALLGQRQVAAHQRDLVAEAGGFAGGLHPFAEARRGFFGTVNEDVLGGTAGSAERLEPPGR